MAKDSLLSQARRIVRFGVKTGIAGDMSLGHAPYLARMVVGAGLNIKTVHALHARTTPHQLAAVDARRALNYQELEHAIRAATASFRAAGVVRGRRVVICMENRVEYLVAWFALFRIGAGAVHASYRSTPAELDYLFDHSDAIGVVFSDQTEPAISNARSRPTLALNADVDFWDWLSTGGDDSIDTDAGGDNVVYTSGTTGAPKGAVRDFASMGVIELSRILDQLPMRKGDRHLVVCPLYHSGAQALALIHTSLGATLYLSETSRPDAVLESISRNRIHSMFVVPTILQNMLDLPRDAWHAHPPTELRCVLSGAALFPHALRQRAIRQLGASVVFDFYGATELGWVTLIGGGEMMQREGSIGRALPGQEIRIVDAYGRDLPNGEVGTLYVRNEQIMQGYLADDAATSKTLLDGGWMTVDDLARIDDEGYLYLAGRNRDMVISGGVNLYPVEIEEVLAQHPAVREVAVFGVPDPRWGETLAACVVWEEAPEQEALETYVRARLSGVKVPRRWFHLDQLPRNPTGKILKRELRARFS